MKLQRSTILKFILLSAFLSLMSFPAESFAEKDIYRNAPTLLKALASHSGKKPFQYKNTNQAVSLMRDAGYFYHQGGNNAISNTLKTLNKSISYHKSNSLAYYLKAYLYAKFLGNKSEELKSLQKFLSLSHDNYGAFEEQFISPGNFYKLREVVLEKHPEKGALESAQEGLVPPAISNYLRHNDLPNMIVLGILIVGAMLLLCCHMMGISFQSLLAKNLIAFYSATVLSYMAWVITFALALPFEINHLMIIPIIYVIMACAVLISAWSDRIEQANIPLEEGYIRCPHCNAIIEKLLVECSQCQKSI